MGVVVFIVVGMLNLFILFIGLALGSVYCAYLYFVFHRNAQRSQKALADKKDRMKNDFANQSMNEIGVIQLDSVDLHGSPGSGIFTGHGKSLRKSQLASQFEAESVYLFQ